MKSGWRIFHESRSPHEDFDSWLTFGRTSLVSSRKTRWFGVRHSRVGLDCFSLPATKFDLAPEKCLNWSVDVGGAFFSGYFCTKSLIYIEHIILYRWHHPFCHYRFEEILSKSYSNVIQGLCSLSIKTDPLLSPAPCCYLALNKYWKRDFRQKCPQYVMIHPRCQTDLMKWRSSTVPVNKSMSLFTDDVRSSWKCLEETFRNVRLFLTFSSKSPKPARWWLSRW